MSKGSFLKGLVVIGCSVLLAHSARADSFTNAAESMTDGDASSAYDISGTFFGFTPTHGTVAGDSFWGALILFTAGTGTHDIAIGSGDAVSIVYSPSNTLGALDNVSTGCTVVGAGVASGLTPPTSITDASFAPGQTTAITCSFDTTPFPGPGSMDTGYFALLTLVGTGSLTAGTTTLPSGVTVQDQATLEFLSSSPFGTTSAVPEPASLGVCLLGFAGLALARRRISGAKQ